MTPKKLTPTQERVMWAAYRHGGLNQFTRLGEGPHWSERYAPVSTVRALGSWGFLQTDIRERMRVHVGDQVHESPHIWEASLTRKGEEWVAQHLANSRA
jgi:hypothetical protein